MDRRRIDRIQSGVFIMPFHDAAKPLAQCFDEDLELIIRADELGIEEFWIGEHHTMKYEPIVMPEIFIGRALGDAQTIRMGPGASAPAAAPSGARGRPAGVPRSPGQGASQLLLWAGQRDERPGTVRNRSERRRSDELLEASRYDPEALVEQSARMKSKANTGTSGLQKTVDEETGIGYVHKPYQQPHPPISIPGMSRDSYSMKYAGPAWALSLLLGTA